jgi:diacylglycerol kinase family enzyme
MRIALVHNPEAGDGELGRDDLRRALESAGHYVREFGKKRKDVMRALAADPEVLAIAGGDGTVARATAIAFESGSAVPLCIIPVGTANNISRTLGLDAPVPMLVRAIERAPIGSMDIGRIEGGGVATHFAEGAGLGFIGAMLRNPMSAAKRALSAIRGAVTRVDLRERQARGIAGIIRDQPLTRFTVIADGEDLTGEYLGVEAMNIREIGPNVTLAPGAECDDGLLDLVLFGEEHREGLAARVEASVTQSDPPPCIARRVRRVELSWPGDGHSDDKPWPKTADSIARVTIEIAGAVRVLRIRQP